MTPPAQGPRGAGSALSTLRRISTTRPARNNSERCEMCAVPIADEHQHVVDLESRALMCTCRGCYLLFTATEADIRFRAVPDRYVSFPDFSLGAGMWDELEIPVNLAFFFVNSRTGTTTAFYPGPAGATESELPLNAWEAVLATNLQLAMVGPDVEALIVRAPGSGRESECYLVPIDACYELVGRLRRVWRGFDGGQDALAEIEGFFVNAAKRSRPAGGGNHV
ncbi:MAG: DUF5947 family protein [Aeromicrobium sp.]